MQESWCLLTLPGAERSCGAAEMTPPKDTALARRVQGVHRFVAGCVASLSLPAPMAGWVLDSAQGWSRMLPRSSA